MSESIDKVEPKKTPEPPPQPRAASPNGQAAKAPLMDRVLEPIEELDVLIRARYPIIYVVSWEEERVEQCLRKIAEKRNKQLFIWTVTQGIVKSGAIPQRAKTGSETTADPLAALDAVINQVEPAIYLFKDFHRFTADERCNLSVVRRLRDVAFHLRDTYKTIIIVAPIMSIAPELAKDVTLVDFGLPRVRDFNRLLDKIIEDVKENPNVKIELPPDDRERLVNAARGLTLKEAENVFAKTLVMAGKLNADDVSVVFSEKQQIIKKSGLLEYYETKENFSNVAGLENLKEWLLKRRIAFTERAVKFGLPAPRGVMLLGVQGCGKSLCAKAASSLWNVPLLRFDLGRMFSSLVGSSEENIRQAIQTAESVAPAILWVDEIDKALAGATSASGSDGGTSSRVFGTLLTWLSEKTSTVFVICTANDISHLPPELLRKGRLDEIFFVDLPTAEERMEIFRIHLQKRKRDPVNFNLDMLARASDGFSGAEIEEAVISALFDAFSQQQDLNTEYVKAALAETVPLSKTMSEEINRLKGWANGRARSASGIPIALPAESVRKIEL
jgi:ATP-dependent 26S proteasome regulatory subunit